MKDRILAAGLFVILAAAAAPSSWALNSTSGDVEALADRVQQLESRVKQLEELVRPNGKDLSAGNQPVDLRERFSARIAQDRATYTAEELREIERLYQIANKQWNSPEAQASLKTLIEKFPKANRTGCALMYLGQMSSGEAREQYLKRALTDFGDCFYGDGVQVGAYARFYLAHHYKEAGNIAQASALFDEIRRQYPDAVDHKGWRLVDSIPP